MATTIQPIDDNGSEQLDDELIPMPSITPSASAVASTPSAANDPPQLIPMPPPVSDTSANISEPSAPSVEEPVVADRADAKGEFEDIKLKALIELKPLIDEVDLPPEQKFHTILEILSATNDKDLIPKLYESAEKIEDKHERAQALIDVVSEIQYLTDPK